MIGADLVGADAPPRRERIPQRLFRPADPEPTTAQVIERHPVLAALAERKALDDLDLEFLVEHGQAYDGVPLPPTVKRRPMGTCFTTAQELHDSNHGEYVAGFAIVKYGELPLPHAWVTTNGNDAIAAVWEDAPNCIYFGIRGHKHDERLNYMMYLVHQRLELGAPPKFIARIPKSDGWGWW